MCSIMYVPLYLSKGHIRNKEDDEEEVNNKKCSDIQSLIIKVERRQLFK